MVGSSTQNTFQDDDYFVRQVADTERGHGLGATYYNSSSKTAHFPAREDSDIFSAAARQGPDPQ